MNHLIIDLMNRGCIKIKESSKNRMTVEVKLVNCTLWVTKYEMADLFNVFVSTIDRNLRAIFGSGLIHQEKVTRTCKYENNGHQCEVTLYNLEVLIFMSYRIASYEAQAFRKWIMKALIEYTRSKTEKDKDILVIYKLSQKHPAITFN